MATKQDIRDIRTDLEKLEYRLVIKLSAILATLLTLSIAVTTALIKLI